MNDWNCLEKDLRTWTPRQPSPELHERIFGAAAAPSTPRSAIGLADFSRWLVPAFGCFLLVIGTLSSRHPVHEVFPLAATNLLFPGNRTAYNDVVVAARADHSDINSLPARRLEWSFGGGAGTATFGSMLVAYTNKLIQ